MKLYDIAAINQGVLDVKNIPGINLTGDAKSLVINGYIEEFVKSATSL
jgi:hypothetical protein